MNNNSSFLLRWIPATLGLFALLGSMPAVLGQAQSAHPPARVQLDDSPLDAKIRAATSLAPVVKKATPSVVSVVTTKFVNAHDAVKELLPFYFEEREQGQDRPLPPNVRMPVESVGSGVIVTEDGYILTNTHVVEDVDEIKILLSDGETEHAATVVGKDDLTDIAVLKVAAGGLPAITIAHPDTLEVGDLVLAIGNPFKVGQTVTSGMVSAKGRNGFFLQYEDYIQTDAPVNPGNSGGALVDAQGRLVGINTFIMSGAGGSAGVNFAIPADLACFVLGRLVEDGEVRRGYLGVNLEERVTEDLAEEFGLPSTEGALVTRVRSDGPAGQAGIRAGDFITAFNGTPVKDRRNLQFAVAQARPGTEAELSLVRDGKIQTLKMNLGELDLASTGRTGSRRSGPVETLRGVEMVDLSSATRRQFDIPEEIQLGVVVSRVAEDSPAYAAGLREGSLILGAARQDVSSVEDLMRIAATAGEGRLLLRVRLPGGSINYMVIRARD